MILLHFWLIMTYIINNILYFQYYIGCQCAADGIVEEGMCPRNCPTIYSYAVLLFITKFVASMDKIPTMAMLMK